MKTSIAFRPSRGVPLLLLAALLAVPALAVDSAAMVGKWQLVEPARDDAGKPCPFVGQQIEFTADGKMVSGNMPAPFTYKINPTKAETDAAIARRPDLKGMDIMLAAMNPQGDWTKAPIVYGIELKGGILTMKVSGYSPAKYKKQK